MSSFSATSTPFPPLNLPDARHNGTGSNNLVESAKHIVNYTTYADDVNVPFDIVFRNYKIFVFSIQLNTPHTPNWFGVSFRQNIDRFDAVNIFCHPNPGHAGMLDSDYATRSGKWPKLFRYAEMLGSQVSMTFNNQIVIIPFFTNATYGNTGIFGPNWREIVNEILRVVRIAFKGGADDGFKPAVKEVVLSDFSRGRDLLVNLTKHAPGLSKSVREVWDFDGTGMAAPHLGRLITYDHANQNGTYKTNGALKFHAPPKRWINFHHMIPNDIHGDIPEMLVSHATWVSNVG